MVRVSLSGFFGGFLAALLAGSWRLFLSLEASSRTEKRGHPVYRDMGYSPDERRDAYQALFRTALDEAPLRELQMALNQNQPLGNARFDAEIRAMTGQRRERRKRERPKKTELEIGNREDQLERAADG